MAPLSRFPFGNAKRSFYDSMASMFPLVGSSLPFMRREYLTKSANRCSADVLSDSWKFPVEEALGQSGFKWEVKYNESPLSIVGLWPIGNRFVNLKFALCLSLMLAHTLPSLFKIFFIDLRGSGENPLQVLTEATSIIYTVAQFVVFKNKSFKVKILITKIYEDWERSANLNDEDKKPMLFYGGRTRAMTAACMGFLFVTYLGYSVEPLFPMIFKGNSSLMIVPTAGIYPFDINRSPNYEIVYAFQVSTGAMCAVSLISIDSFLMLSSFHGCGQLAILSKMINRYDGQTRHESTSRDDSERALKYHCSCLKCIVDRHVSLREYTRIIDDTFNEIVMARLITSTIYFCGIGYTIIESNEKSNFSNVLVNLVYMSTMTFDLFLYCWIGQQLLEEGENVGRAVYELEWYKKKPKIARSLVLPILQSRRSLKVTAGRFFVLSFSCFKNWFTNSVGYLSVILAIKTQT